MSKVEPLCAVFGECGGCRYQDIPYSEELEVKEVFLKETLRDQMDVPESVFSGVVASPIQYGYRNRLDMTMRLRRGEWWMGFVSPIKKYVLEVEDCPIARKEINKQLKKLKRAALKKMPEDYRNANLVVRVGDEKKVQWGGVGRRSLKQTEKDYFWTEIRGIRIHYSLDTFFQANLSILPALMDKIEEAAIFDSKTVFWDLYGGVGLFAMIFAAKASEVYVVEESSTSIRLARYNKSFHSYSHMRILEAKVETVFEQNLMVKGKRHVAIIDPPRKGLSEEVRRTLNGPNPIETFFYLSCSPESLARDLRDLSASWEIENVTGFDFFPRTHHLETLVKLRRKND